MAIPQVLNFDHKGPRRFGMIRGEHALQSLHQANLDHGKPRLPTPEDINAPPLGSSDEASDGDNGEEPEDSDFGAKKSRKEPSNFGHVKQETSDSEAKDSADAIWDPSSADQPKDGKKKSPKSSNGSPGSQKRSSRIHDDDMNLFGSSEAPRKKKAKTKTQNTYSSSQNKPVNIHSTEAEEPEEPRSQKSRIGKNGFRAPPDSKFRRKPHDPEPPPIPQGPTFKKPPSQVSLKASQDSSDTKAKPKFNVPKRTSPRKKKATFKPGPLANAAPEVDVTELPQSTRSPPLGSYDTNVSKPFGGIKSAAHAAAEKLGLGELENIAPSSDLLPDASNLISAGGHDPMDELDLPELQDMVPSSSTNSSYGPNSSYRRPLSVSSELSSPPQSPKSAKCPLCNAIVDQSFLDEFADGRRLRIRQQARFCKAHKMRSAKTEWKERGYPDIDWPRLDQRVTKYHPVIDDILKAKKSSFYRNVFADSIKNGKNRTLRQTLMQGESIEGLSPGYYGSRGARIMVDNIITRFASLLRRLAASDKLISTGGVSGYVQAVLAPEMAVLLVMEDMKTDEEGARACLRENIEIGALLNEEEDEEILDPEPEGVEGADEGKMEIVVVD